VADINSLSSLGIVFVKITGSKNGRNENNQGDETCKSQRFTLSAIFLLRVSNTAVVLLV